MICHLFSTRWRHQMETFSMLLAICEGNPPVTIGFHSRRPMTWNFEVFFDVCLNKRLRKISRHRWFEMPSRSLWCHCNAPSYFLNQCWHLVNTILRNKLQWNLSNDYDKKQKQKKNPTFSCKEMHLKISICKMSAILSWPQFVKSNHCWKYNISNSDNSIFRLGVILSRERRVFLWKWKFLIWVNAAAFLGRHLCWSGSPWD